MARRSPDQALVERLERVREMLGAIGPEVIGHRLRRLRNLQGLSIREVASKAQISKNSLLRLEQGGGTQPVTVLKVCSSLGLHIERLADESPVGLQVAAVHRKADDRWFDISDMGSERLLGHNRPLKPSERRRAVAKGAHTPVNLLQARLLGGRAFPSVLEIYQETPARSHVGEELAYVLKGRAVITVGTTKYTLAEGECLSFWSAEPHSYAPASNDQVPVQILSVRIEG